MLKHLYMSQLHPGDNHITDPLLSRDALAMMGRDIITFTLTCRTADSGQHQVHYPPAHAGDIRDTGSIPRSGMATHTSVLAWRIP